MFIRTANAENNPNLAIVQLTTLDILKAQFENLRVDSQAKNSDQSRREGKDWSKGAWVTVKFDSEFKAHYEWRERETMSDEGKLLFDSAFAHLDTRKGNIKLIVMEMDENASYTASYAFSKATALLESKPFTTPTTTV